MKFIENYLYVSKENTLQKDLPKGDYYALLLDSSTPYIERVEAAFELQTLLAQQVSLHRTDYDSQNTVQGIHLRFAELLKTVSTFTGYLVGCESWRKGKIQSFDQHELIKRLENIILMVKNG